MQGINFIGIISVFLEKCGVLKNPEASWGFTDIPRISYNVIHGGIHCIWHFLGLYLPTHATFLTIICSLTGIYLTLRRNRKIAKEKNALEFDNYCQTNKECSIHYAKVRSICKEIMDENDNIIKELQVKRVGVFCDLPERLNKDREFFEQLGYTRKQIRKILNDKYEEELEYFSSIGFILNLWERCATAILNDVYDENIIYDVQCRAAIIIYDTFRPYIKSAQERNNDRVFMNFEWLIKKWKLEQCKVDVYTKREKQAFKAFEKAKDTCDYVESIKEKNIKTPKTYIKMKLRIFFAEIKLNKYKNK